VQQAVIKPAAGMNLEELPPAPGVPLQEQQQQQQRKRALESSADEASPQTSVGDARADDHADKPKRDRSKVQRTTHSAFEPCAPAGGSSPLSLEYGSHSPVASRRRIRPAANQTEQRAKK
jgi:hypothetical protein